MLCAALDPVLQEFHYIASCPDEASTVHRALNRGPYTLTASEPIHEMYRQFAHLGTYEHHVIDSTTLAPAAIAERIQQAPSTGQFNVRPK